MSGPYQQQPTPPGAPPQPGTVYGQARPGPGYGEPRHAAQSAPLPGYGQPQPPGPPGYPYPNTPPPPRAGNGFAVAALVFGILGGIPLALGFGVAGLVRAAKVQRGRVMSIVGMTLSVLWLVPVVFLATHVAKAADPGCVAAKSVVSTYGDTKLNADASDPAAMSRDLQTLVTQLNAAAGRSGSGAARTAIGKLAGDFAELQADLDKRTQPAADLQTRIDADAKAVDAACGTIG